MMYDVLLIIQKLENDVKSIDFELLILKEKLDFNDLNNKIYKLVLLEKKEYVLSLIYSIKEKFITSL